MHELFHIAQITVWLKFISVLLRVIMDESKTSPLCYGGVLIWTSVILLCVRCETTHVFICLSYIWAIGCCTRHELYIMEIHNVQLLVHYGIMADLKSNSRDSNELKYNLISYRNPFANRRAPTQNLSGIQAEHWLLLFDNKIIRRYFNIDKTSHLTPIITLPICIY